MPEEHVFYTRPLEWHVSKDVVTKYATNLVVQNTDNEFILSFFETYPPILLGTPDERRVKADEITKIRAECIVRIVISVDRMPDFIDVMKENLEGFTTRQMDKEE